MYFAKNKKLLAQKSEKGISITKVLFDIGTEDWMQMQTGSDDPRTMRARFDELSYTPPPVGSSGTHVSNDIVNYLNGNSELTADTHTSGSATWTGADFMTAPGDLPATSLNNFIIYFGGGTLISHDDIISFVDN